MNKNKRENIWATFLRLLRDRVPSKIKALWMCASRKITHGRNKGHRNYARTSCTESHAHTSPVDIWFVPVCSACLNLVKIANLVWCVLRAFLGMCLVVSQTNLSFQAGFVCCQQWDHWEWSATLILAAPRDEAKCSTHSTQGQIKDSACWSWSLR